MIAIGLLQTVIIDHVCNKPSGVCFGLNSDVGFFFSRRVVRVGGIPYYIMTLTLQEIITYQSFLIN